MAANHTYRLTIKENLPQPDIRERLREAGSPAVSDHELLAAILGTGIRGKDVRSLASEILAVNNFSAAIPSVKDLIKTSGLGHAGACRIIAALELGRRFYGTRGRRVLNPQDAWQLVRHHADCRREHFIGCTLNGAHDLIAVRVITTGLINKTIIHPREVFADAVADRACAILVAHNHPSGRLEASVEDLEITNRLQEAGELLGIPLLDHLIFSEHNFVSLVEAGVIKRGGICNSP